MMAAKNGGAMRQPAENPLALLCTIFLLQKYTYGQGMQKQAKQCSDMHVTTTPAVAKPLKRAFEESMHPGMVFVTITKYHMN